MEQTTEAAKKNHPTNPLAILKPPTIEARLDAMENMLREMHALLTHFHEMATMIEQGIANSPMAGMLGIKR